MKVSLGSTRGLVLWTNVLDAAPVGGLGLRLQAIRSQPLPLTLPCSINPLPPQSLGQISMSSSHLSQIQPKYPILDHLVSPQTPTKTILPHPISPDHT